MSLTSAVRAPAKIPAKSAIIFVHGLGDSGNGWLWFPQVASQGVRGHESINYVFPNAPNMPVTGNGGMVMPLWFDVYDFLFRDGRQDVQGFMKSCNVLKEFIKEQMETHHIPADRIILGGFSQGAALALATLAFLDFKIAGVVALLGFLKLDAEVENARNKSGVNNSTPVFQGHGEDDPLVKIELGRKTSEFYRGLGFQKLQFNSYPGVAHSAGDQELADVVRFIDGVLNE